MRQLTDLFGGQAAEFCFIRKKDGLKYWTNLNTSNHLAIGEAIYLKPQSWGGRSHWKSLAAFKAQYTNLDGSKIE